MATFLWDLGICETISSFFDILKADKQSNILKFKSLKCQYLTFENILYFEIMQGNVFLLSLCHWSLSGESVQELSFTRQVPVS